MLITPRFWQEKKMTRRSRVTLQYSYCISPVRRVWRFFPHHHGCDHQTQTEVWSSELGTRWHTRNGGTRIVLLLQSASHTVQCAKRDPPLRGASSVREIRRERVALEGKMMRAMRASTCGVRGAMSGDRPAVRSSTNPGCRRSSVSCGSHTALRGRAQLARQRARGDLGFVPRGEASWSIRTSELRAVESGIVVSETSSVDDDDDEACMTIPEDADGRLPDQLENAIPGDFYSLLQLEPGAEPNEVKAQYRQLQKWWGGGLRDATRRDRASRSG